MEGDKVTATYSRFVQEDLMMYDQDSFEDVCLKQHRKRGLLPNKVLVCLSAV